MVPPRFVFLFLIFRSGRFIVVVVLADLATPTQTAAAKLRSWQTKQ